MKAKINNIEFEGTPAEFAEFIQLQTSKVEHSEKQKTVDEIRRIINPHRARSATNLFNVSYQDTPIGTMTMTELSVLFDKPRETLRNWFTHERVINYNGYSATIASRGNARGRSIRLKATDSKGNNRIYQSIISFCQDTKTDVDKLRRERYKHLQGPWKINGYIVERIN